MKITKEVQIAIVAILGLIVLFFGLQFLKGLNLFSDTNNYKIKFDNINGLGNTTPVFADGYKVGFVTKITYDYEKERTIIVDVELDKNLRVPKGSSAEIESDLMGNMKVSLLMANNPREAVEPGGTIDGRLYSGALAQVSNMIPAVEQMLPKLDSILTSVNNLLASPALTNSLHNVEVATQNLTVTTSEANKLIAALNEKVPTLANSVLTKADVTMDNTAKFTGNRAQIDLANTMSQLNQTLATANSAVVKLNNSMSDINVFTANLNTQKGTLGKLLNDPGLYNNLNNTLGSADSLLIDLKAHPKRYVHFSLFGKKDN